MQGRRKVTYETTGNPKAQAQINKLFQWNFQRNIQCNIQRNHRQNNRYSRQTNIFPTLSVLLFPLIFLALFFYLPLFSIMREGLTDESGRFTVKQVLSIITDVYYLRIILFTIEQAILSTIASILLGLPGAYLLAGYEFRGKSVIKAITTVPFVLPSIIVVLGFVIFFGNSGVLNRLLQTAFRLNEPPLKILYSMKAIILAHTFYNFPICIRLVSAVWSRINPNIERAARSLGAKGFTLFRTAILPQIIPGILASAALIFIFCFTSFAVILVLGGGPRFSTIEVEIYRLAKVSIDFNRASALAIWEAVFTIIFMFVYIKLQHRVSFAEKVELRYERPRLSSILRSVYGPAVILYLALVFSLIIAPMLAAVHYSFLEKSSRASQFSYTLGWYKLIFTNARERAITVSYGGVIRNSLFFGFLTVLFSLPIGTAIAYLTSRKKIPFGGFLESTAMLPLGISTIMLGFQITGKWYAIACAHAVIAYPFVIRSTSAVFKKISPSIIQAASSLGANRWKTFWHIELPMIKSGIIAGATFAFAISIGEINATLMLYSPDLTTLPIAIYRLISSYNYFAACALGTVLMVICFLVFFIIDRMGFEIS